MSSQSAAPAAPSESDLAASLDGLSIADAARLRRRLDGVRKLRDPKRRAGSLSRIQQDAAAARLRVLERAAAVPVVSYPPELPVSRARDELAEAIEKHQVVIVAGETGSGKTTQLPKICLELGRGVDGPDRPHPAAPDRRPHRRRAHRRGAGHASWARRSATRSASPTRSARRRSSS